MKKQNILVILISLIFIPSLIYLTLFNNYFFGDSYLYGFAEWYSPYSLNHLTEMYFNSNFLYSDLNWGVPSFYPLISIYYGFYSGISGIIGIIGAQKLLIFSLFYFSFLSGFLLFKQFTKESRVSYILALIFSFNPFLLNHLIFGHIILIISMINLMFSCYFLINFYKKKNKFHFFLFILFLALNPIHPLYIPFFFILYFLLGVYSNIPIKKNIFLIIIALFLLMLFHSFWTLNLIINSKASAEVMTYHSGTLEGIKQQSKPILNSILNSEYFNKDLFLNNNRFYQTLYDCSRILLFLILLILLVSIKEAKNKRFYTMTFIVIVLLMLLLTGSFNPLPLGKLIFNFFLFIKIYSLYKEVYHFTFLLIPLILILFCFAYESLQENVKKRYKNFLSTSLILILALMIISISVYSNNESLSNKLHSWNSSNLEENDKFYNSLCYSYKTTGYILFVPFYNNVYDTRSNSADKEGGADSLIASSCISSIGNSVTLNYPFKIILEVFNDNLSNEEIFTNKGISYIIFRKNFMSGNENYYNSTFLRFRISNDAKFSLIEENEDFIVYSNGYNQGIISSSNLIFTKVNPVKYRVYTQTISQSQSLSFLVNFNPDWKLYLVKHPSSSWCTPIEFYENTNTTECEHTQKFFEGEELSYLWKKPIFDETHTMVYEYANGWTIDPQYIKDNFSKDYYKENPDGSIDIELVMYFKPQSYFYLGLIISGITLVGCIGYLIYDWRRNKYKRKIEDEKSI